MDNNEASLSSLFDNFEDETEELKAIDNLNETEEAPAFLLEVLTQQERQLKNTDITVVYLYHGTRRLMEYMKNFMIDIQLSKYDKNLYSENIILDFRRELDTRLKIIDGTPTAEELASAKVFNDNYLQYGEGVI